MKSSHTRRPLKQQAVTEQKGPFFPKAKEEAQKKDDVFFQAKLAVGGQNDKHEQEADGMADKVQRKSEDKDKESDKGAAGPAASSQDKGDKGSAGQASPGADKDKTPGSKDAAGAAAKDKAPDKGAAGPASAAPQKDKAPDKGAGAQNKDKAPDKSAAGPAADAAQKDKAPDKGAAPAAGGKDKEPDKSAAPAAGKEEEQKTVSRKTENDKEPEVQKMSATDKKDDKETKVSKKEEPGKDTVMEPTQVMREEAPAPAPTPVHPGAHKTSLEERIRKSKGKGHPLSEEVRSFLEAELGADFSEVVIHTDSDAVAMSKELNALAFTNGFDIYFNAGQYRPDTQAGQKLLAHELTHVIQQTGVSKKTKQKK